jgi:transposase
MISLCPPATSNILGARIITKKGGHVYMITIGVDFHKRTSSYTVLDERGIMITQCKLENTKANIERFLDRWQGPKRLAMEATYNWGLYHDIAQSHVDHFLLGHPYKMRAITESETKCDRHDAAAIARLAMMDYLPKAYAPPRESRDLRSLVRFRNFLVRQRVSIKNNTQALIDRNLWPSDRPRSFKNIYCKRGMTWLKSLGLPPKERFILDGLISAFDNLALQIKEVESYIEQVSCDMPEVKYLRTISGLRTSRINLYTILFEIDTISRFAKARDLARYAGLIPSEHSSGDKHRAGRLVRRANTALRTAIIEATFAAILHDPNLKAYYRTVKARNNSSAAIIACSRKLCYAIYHVLKEKRPFIPFTPAAASGPSAT